MATQGVPSGARCFGRTKEDRYSLSVRNTFPCLRSGTAGEISTNLWFVCTLCEISIRFVSIFGGWRLALGFPPPLSNESVNSSAPLPILSVSVGSCGNYPYHPGLDDSLSEGRVKVAANLDPRFRNSFFSAVELWNRVLVRRLVRLISWVAVSTKVPATPLERIDNIHTRAFGATLAGSLLFSPIFPPFRGGAMAAAMAAPGRHVSILRCKA